MKLGYYHRLNNRLTHAKRLGLKHLLSLRLKFKEPENPYAVRGFEGMRDATRFYRREN